MVRVSVARSAAVLALIAACATGCSSSSSSSATSAPSGGVAPTGGSSDGTTAGTSLELRPIYARYASGVPLGAPSDLQLGPSVPKDVVDAMKSYKCSSPPTVLQGMRMECDAGGTVYLLKAPIAAGGVAKAEAKQIGHQKLWFVDVAFDPQVTGVLADAFKTMPGTELAFALKTQVLTAPIIDESMVDGTVGITGSYDKKQATKLATEISAS
jgi:hypothetical protein